MKAEEDETVYLWRTPYHNVSEVDYAVSIREFFLALAPELPAEGTVVLKPNVTVPIDSDSAIVTHCDFIGGLLDALLYRGVSSDRLTVTEGHVRADQDGNSTWTVAGYTQVAEARGVSLLEVDDDEATRAIVPDGVAYQSLPLTATLTNAAMIINVPIAKCHNLSLTTLSMKNMMGMVRVPSRHFCRAQDVDQPFHDRLLEVNGRGISLLEERFCHKLSDLASAVRSLSAKVLHVVSGIVGRDGTGFATGTNYLLNLIAASDNPVHLDTVVTYLMGLDPLKTPYLNVAAERGLGTNRIEEIEIVDLRRERRVSLEELERFVHQPAFVPMTRSSSGYVSRFRTDRTLVPWALEQVNGYRTERGLAPIAAA